VFSSRLLTIAVVALVATPRGLAGQCGGVSSAARAQIDRIVTTEMASRHIPGVALAVSRDGRMLFAKGFGFANLEHDIPVTPTTVFKIGSVSKQFIASGVMLLVQEGRLSLEDPVAKHVPGAPASWSGITLRHLLNHTSGIRREGPAFDPLKVQADSIVIQSAFADTLQFATGSRWQYCNVCYFTLADVIRRTAGVPWADFIRDRIFLPSGMKDSRTTTTTELVPRRASGYVWRDGRYLPAPEYLALRPSGAFLSTVLDLVRWDSVLTQGGILTPATQKTMTTPALLKSGAPAVAGDTVERPGYGLGWSVDTHEGRGRVHHGGALPGFRAEMSRYPDGGWTVIVLTNGDGASPTRIEEQIAAVLFKEP
jgi:CubicO group peptidase (beta-lactamase class C family)